MKMLPSIAGTLFLAGCFHMSEPSLNPHGEKRADAGTDLDTDTDGDSDADSDTDADADMDADSDADGDADADTDADGDSDTFDTTPRDTDTEWDTGPSDDCEDYQYPADCLGETCKGGMKCCKGAVCNDEILVGNDDNPYLNLYCYPECNEPGWGAQCECDDICVEFPTGGWGKTWSACISQSTVRTDSFQAKIFGDIDKELGMSDVSTVKIEVAFDGQKKPLNMAFGFKMEMDLDGDGQEDDEAYLWMAQGNVGMTEIWALQIVIPAEFYYSGSTIDSPTLPGDNGADVMGYRATLQRLNIKGQEVDQAWMEAMAVDGQIEIHDTGNICYDYSYCEKTDAWFDINMVNLKAQLDID
jgi:hypothetical protein